MDPARPPDTTPSASASTEPVAQWRQHLRDPLYRTGYFLIAGSGVGSLLGFAFWVLAARSYTTHVVGVNSVAISAMMLVSGICSLGLNAVLVRYLPNAGGLARRFVLRTYGLTAALSLAVGALVALTSELWSPTLSFLGEDLEWFLGFTAAVAVWTIFSLQDSVMTGLRAAHWVPIENSLYSVAKLIALVAVAAALPVAGPFVAWNAPAFLTLIAVTVLIFRRLIPSHVAKAPAGTLDRDKVLRTARGNYGGTLFSLALMMFMPVLVANATDTTEAAFFYVPWTISIGMQLIAMNMTASLTVEAALDEARLAQLCRQMLVQTLRLLLPLATVLAVAAPLVLRAFGEDYADAGSLLLRLLALGALPNVVVALGLAVARIEHRGRLILAIQAGQCVLGIGLSAALLPSLGIEGVGYAWLASQVTVAAAVALGPLRPLLSAMRRAR